MLFATISPISWIETRSSTFAFLIPSKLLKFLAKSLEVFTPTLGIPKEYTNELKSQFLLFSIAFSKFCAFFSPNFSKVNSSSFFKVYKSLKDFMSSFSNSCSAVFSLNPSIFMASLQAKCTMLFTICGLQDNVFSQK